MMKNENEQSDLRDASADQKPQHPAASADSGKVPPKKRKKATDNDSTPQRRSRRVTVPAEVYAALERIVQAVNGVGPLKTSVEDIIGTLVERFGDELQDDLKQHNSALRRRRRGKGEDIKP